MCQKLYFSIIYVCHVTNNSYIRTIGLQLFDASMRDFQSYEISDSDIVDDLHLDFKASRVKISYKRVLGQVRARIRVRVRVWIGEGRWRAREREYLSRPLEEGVWVGVKGANEAGARARARGSHGNGVGASERGRRELRPHF